jgi:hypothetical protein
VTEKPGDGFGRISQSPDMSEISAGLDREDETVGNLGGPSCERRSIRKSVKVLFSSMVVNSLDRWVSHRRCGSPFG